jgi:hypothetical protein
MRLVGVRTCVAVFLGLMAGVSLAQTSTSKPGFSSQQPTSPGTGAGGPSSGGGGGTPVGRYRQPPYWQQAGISKEVLQQRHSLEQAAHSQIASVCADTSLGPQQKREKIREIHQQTSQQVQALMTPQQQEALKSCQAARNGGHDGAPHPHAGGGMGPCGEAPSVASPQSKP